MIAHLIPFNFVGDTLFLGLGIFVCASFGGHCPKCVENS